MAAFAEPRASVGEAAFSEPRAFVGEASLALEVGELFAELGPVALHALEHAFEEGDAATARFEAHALKGMAVHFSGPCSGLASELEQLAEDGMLAGAGDLLGRLRIEMDRLLASLQQPAYG